MVDAFDDPGDIPKFEVIDKTQKIFGKGTDAGSLFPFTKSGGKVSAWEPQKLYTQALYNDGDTSVPLSSRGLLTKQIKTGKPNYQGDTTLTGKTVCGIAFIIAATDPQEFFDSLRTFNKFVGFRPMHKLASAWEKLITPDPRTR